MLTSMYTRGMDIIEERFWSKVRPTGFCWEWLDTPAKTGYGRISIKNKAYYAHRVSWELLIGCIPDGYTLDHLCRNKICVNPDHLEPVTLGENARRARLYPSDRSKVANNQWGDVCKRGHLRKDHTYVSPRGHRHCRKCNSEISRERKRAKRSSVD